MREIKEASKNTIKKIFIKLNNNSKFLYQYLKV